MRFFASMLVAAFLMTSAVTPTFEEGAKKAAPAAAAKKSAPAAKKAAPAAKKETKK